MGILASKVVAVASFGWGSSVVLHSSLVAMVNWMGATAGDIVAGSFLAWVQSHFYGAFTCGALSLIQGFGASATVAFSPVLFSLGTTSMLIGGGYLRWYKK